MFFEKSKLKNIHIFIGPDPATTIVAEEIFMNFVLHKEEHEKDEEKTPWDKVKDNKGGVVTCRICKEDHWTTHCPYKEKVGLLKDLQMDAGEEKPGATPAIGGPPTGVVGTSGTQKSGGTVYVPPGRREGARGGESMNDRRRSKIFFLSFFLSFLFYDEKLELKLIAKNDSQMIGLKIRDTFSLLLVLCG